ncbi:MAG TPA: VCBS repeat-containing protein [Polyangiaceae bacterium]|nr:VCBS repeat-containing protein [Polyangiaceae bacterium]
MRLRQLLATGSLWLLGSACTEFPSIPDTGCGNRVIELGTEDCDTFDPYPGSLCRPKGTENECRLDCAFDDNGVQRKCPLGWGCNADSICRPPSGQFTETSLASDVGAWTLKAGDFDADGRQEVMSSEPLDATGATRLRFNHFDAQGALIETQLFPKTLLSPTINQISEGDAISDIAFTTGALGVMYGRRDRSWVPEVFSSYRRRQASVRVVGVYDRTVQWSPPFATLISFPTETGFYLADPDTGGLTERLSIPGRIDQLVGDLVSGNIFADSKHSPCFEPVYAMRGATHFSIVDACDSDDQGAVVWRATFLSSEIPLVPAARIDAAPQVLDMDGDGNLDVLLGANGRPYVAFGDGSSLAAATPYLAHARDPAFPQGTPLAVADFSGDGALDFVYPDRLLVSRTAYPGAIPSYQKIGNRHTSPWTVAKIADFNGNHLLDVVAGSSGSLNLDFFNGTGTANLAASVVSTSAPVQFLSAGDFDGDRITDLSLCEVPLPDQTVSTVKVAFGSAFAALGSPLAVGQIAHLEALGSYQDTGRDNLTVCSGETVDSVQSGALTLFAGGPDRIPFAPLALTEFSSTGSVQDANAFAVVSGRFVSSNQADLLALAFFDPIGGSSPINVWSVPAIAKLGSAPARLPGALDPRLTPVAFSRDNDGSFSANVASASADFDDDGRDEAVFAMPADGGSHCGLLLIGADAQGSFGSVERSPLMIEEPCTDPQILPVRFPGDRAVHLALLTGPSNGEGRHLYLLWNDGAGQFSAENRVLVSDSKHSPQAFTLLPAEEGLGGFAYITQNSLSVVRAPNGREFADSQLLRSVAVSNGTGIVAADVNGDHVSDLVFSESGKLHVLIAGLTLP